MKTDDLHDLVGQLERVKDGAELEKWKASHQLSTELLGGIWSRLQDLLTVDPQTALRLSEWMLSIAFDVKDPYMKAMALRAKGNSLVSIDDYFQAIEYFEEALKIFGEIGDQLEVAGTMMNRVVVYLRLSRFEEALADADRVTEMFSKLGDERRLGR